MAKYTLTNLLSNSSFENTGWGNTAYCTLSYDTAVKKYGDYSLKVTATRTSSGEVYFANSTNVNMIQNHIYYACCELYQTSSVCSGMQAYWPQAEPNMGTASVSEINKWVKCGFRASRTSWSGSQNFRFDVENIVAPNYVYLDGAMLIDLTEAFGSGNEPSVEWCNSNIKYFEGTKTISASLPTTYDLTSIIPTEIVTGDILNCPYSGTVKSITLPKGTYKLECWGAQGGSGTNGSGNNATSYKHAGLGGYSKGTITLKSKQTLYLVVGGQGTDATGKSTTGYAGGYNGGGKGGNLSSTSSYTNGAGGGGGTDIRIGTNSLYARVIVAGGGGGSSWSSTSGSTVYAGYGGGTSGTAANKGDGNALYIYAGGGTATAGGQGGQCLSSTTQGNSGTFGVGGNGLANSSSYINSGAGGGGGWYGGGGCGACKSGYQAHAGGGSGYVYTSSTASNYPSGCLLNSSYYLTDASTVAGNTSFIGTSGSSETGHSGNGYIRITAIKVGSVTFRAKRKLHQVEYLESSGTQYIDTGLVATNNTKISITFERQGIDGCLIATDTAWCNTGFGIWSHAGEYGNTCITSISLSDNIKHTVVNDKGKFYIDGSLYTTLTANTFSTAQNLYLFALNRAGSIIENYTGKFYSCQIYDNDVLVRDFVPAIDGSGKACLYDKVTQAFFYNGGSGTFAHGNNVDSDIYAITSTDIGYVKVLNECKPLVKWFAKVNGEWRLGV